MGHRQQNLSGRIANYAIKNQGSTAFPVYTAEDPSVIKLTVANGFSGRQVIEEKVLPPYRPPYFLSELGKRDNESDHNRYD